MSEGKYLNDATMNTYRISSHNHIARTFNTRITKQISMKDKYKLFSTELKNKHILPRNKFTVLNNIQ